MKHVIHLKETFDSAVALGEGLKSIHDKYFDRYPYAERRARGCDMVDAISDSLQQKNALANSLGLQATSLEKRIERLMDLVLNAPLL